VSSAEAINAKAWYLASLQAALPILLLCHSLYLLLAGTKLVSFHLRFEKYHLLPYTGTGISTPPPPLAHPQSKPLPCGLWIIRGRPPPPAHWRGLPEFLSPFFIERRFFFLDTGSGKLRPRPFVQVFRINSSECYPKMTTCTGTYFAIFLSLPSNLMIRILYLVQPINPRYLCSSFFILVFPHINQPLSQRPI